VTPRDAIGAFATAGADSDDIVRAASDSEPDLLRHVRRNDPCPCASGRKYRKCCRGKPEAAGA
jgi:uncharacterized protein